MAQDKTDAGSGREFHRYRVNDPETQGTYVLVSAAPKTQAEIDEIIASVIHDEGRVRPRRVRTILI